MQASLKVTPRLLVLDLGEVRRLASQDGPRLARYIAVMRAVRASCVRMGRGAGHAHLMRAGLPPGETLLYTLPQDPLDFEQDGAVLRLPGLRLYLAGPPEFIEAPFYAWVEP